MDIGPDFEAMARSLHDGLYFVDTQRQVTFWNKAAERISGFTKEEVVGHRCSDNILVHVDAEGHELCKGLCPLAATLADGVPREADAFLHHKQGHRVPVAIRVTALTDDTGRIVGGIELFTDRTSQEALLARLEELEKLALLDPLTRLANRRYIEAAIEAQIALFQREGVPFSIVFADVDHFKHFNDEHGHAVGDKALLTIARTMSNSVRPFDTIGRWGGEEFLGVLSHCNRCTAGTLAQRLRMLVRHSLVETADAHLRVTVSIGVAVSRPGDTVDSIVRRADGMMYKQKKRGRDGVSIEEEGDSTDAE
jgi:diguanylate cyclase (GGDEF)-like protein/PAS domain S-box-containing protein